jgi:hypothetical protein
MGFLFLGGDVAVRDKKKNKDYVSTVTSLTREQIDYLDKLGKDAHFEYGHKLSRARILSELVKLLMQLGVRIKDIDLKKETLAEGIMRVMNNHEEKLSI